MNCSKMIHQLPSVLHLQCNMLINSGRAIPCSDLMLKTGKENPYRASSLLLLMMPAESFAMASSSYRKIQRRSLQRYVRHSINEESQSTSMLIMALFIHLKKSLLSALAWDVFYHILQFGMALQREKLNDFF